MEAFLNRHAGAVIGVLSGFDRLVFRGMSQDKRFGRKESGDWRDSAAGALILTW